MRTALVIVLLAISATISCQKSTENCVETSMERLMESIQKSELKFENLISNVTEQLKTLSDNQHNTAEIISVLEDNIVANNSRILERLTKMESVMEQNQKFLEEQMNVININFSAVSDNIQKNIIDELTKSIELINSRVIENQTISDCGAFTNSGVYQLEKPAKTVYCEMNSTFGGRWLVIQQRVDRILRFDRTWEEYRDGFGVVTRNESFWLGNEAIHQITNGGYYELAIEYRYSNESTKEARYSQFRLAGEDEKYRMTVGKYSGSLGDYLSAHNNTKFSSSDKDYNDANANRKCPTGWWYSRINPCSWRDPNYQEGLFWYAGFSADFSRMMIRRK